MWMMRWRPSISTIGTSAVSTELWRAASCIRRSSVRRSSQRFARHQQRTRPAPFGAPPVEAAHARQVLRARQLALAAFELDPRLAGAQHVLQAAGEQAPLGGLDEEVGRTGLVGAGDRRVVVQPGQHQHRRVLVARHAAQRAAGVEAVEPGHQRVEHDDVGGTVAQHLEGALAAAGFAQLEALVAQGQRGEHQVHLVVVDEQHFRLGRVTLWRVGKRCGRGGRSGHQAVGIRRAG
jgi:hypothetical protein